MNRYQDIQIQKDQTGRRYKKTIVLPSIEPSELDTYIIGQYGDRLDLLAFKYYGDSSYWWIIALANDLGKGDLTVPVGVQIRIPADQYSIEAEYKELNNIG